MGNWQIGVLFTVNWLNVIASGPLIIANEKQLELLNTWQDGSINCCKSSPSSSFAQKRAAALIERQKIAENQISRAYGLFLICAPMLAIIIRESSEYR